MYNDKARQHHNDGFFYGVHGWQASLLQSMDLAHNNNNLARKQAGVLNTVTSNVDPSTPHSLPCKCGGQAGKQGLGGLSSMLAPTLILHT